MRSRDSMKCRKGDDCESDWNHGHYLWSNTYISRFLGFSRSPWDKEKENEVSYYKNHTTEIKGKGKEFPM